MTAELRKIVNDENKDPHKKPSITDFNIATYLASGRSKGGGRAGKEGTDNGREFHGGYTGLMASDLRRRDVKWSTIIHENDNALAILKLTERHCRDGSRERFCFWTRLLDHFNNIFSHRNRRVKSGFSIWLQTMDQSHWFSSSFFQGTVSVCGRRNDGLTYTLLSRGLLISIPNLGALYHFSCHFLPLSPPQSPTWRPRESVARLLIVTMTSM